MLSEHHQHAHAHCQPGSSISIPRHSARTLDDCVCMSLEQQCVTCHLTVSSYVVCRFELSPEMLREALRPDWNRAAAALYSLLCAVVRMQPVRLL